MEKILEAIEIPNENVRESAMQTLVELAHLQYDIIEFYLPKIGEVTARAAN